MESALAVLAEEIRAAAWDLSPRVHRRRVTGRRRSLAPAPRPGRAARRHPDVHRRALRGAWDPQPGPPCGRPWPWSATTREREALGFAPREIVTEFLLLRRVLWRFVSKQSAELTGEEVLEAERRLNDSLDRLVAECVVAYFDRATAELADQARSDPLTGLLNHQAFTRGLEAELERAKRYEQRLTPVHRRRRLQEHQRHARPPRGRPRPPPRRRDPPRVPARLRSRRPDGRRRVRGLPDRGRRGDRRPLPLARARTCSTRRCTPGDFPEEFAISPGLASYPEEVTPTHCSGSPTSASTNPSAKVD